MKNRRSLLVNNAVLPHQQLATAVIRRALIDITDPQVPEDVRRQAEAFVNGSEEIAQWCAVAGIDPELVTRRIERLKLAGLSGGAVPRPR